MRYCHRCERELALCECYRALADGIIGWRYRRWLRGGELVLDADWRRLQVALARDEQ